MTLKKRRPNKGGAGGPGEAGKLFDLDSMEISEEIEQPAKGPSKKSMALQLASQFIQGNNLTSWCHVLIRYFWI